MKKYDVAVVGYGPVGMAMAALLGQAGRQVVVLERYAGLYNLPRAAIFDDETMRTFAKLGIAEELLPKVSAQRNYEWRNGAGDLLIEHEFALKGASGWSEWYMMYQPDLENSLSALCTSLPNVEVRFNSKVEGYAETGEDVLVRVADAGDVRAKYVVACDGGNGITRSKIDAELTDFGFSEPWLVCDFRLTGEARPPHARQVCDPKQPQSIISLGPDHHRFSFMLDSEGDFEIERDPARVWKRVAPYLAPDQAELVRVATYTFRSLLANPWRRGRVILVGDAAHQMPPFLGQGMCSGIRDAHNLAFKLDLLLTGRAHESILDTYQSEREPHVAAVVHKGIELGKVQTMRDPKAAAERDRQYLANRARNHKPEKLHFPGLGPGFLSKNGHPAAGHLFIQDEARTAHTEGRFDEIFGYGPRLVLLRSAYEAFAPESNHDNFEGEVIVLDPTTGQSQAFADIAGSYVNWFEKNRCSAVLVRPDFYIFGAVQTGAEVNGLIREYNESFALEARVPATSGSVTA